MDSSIRTRAAAAKNAIVSERSAASKHAGGLAFNDDRQHARLSLGGCLRRGLSLALKMTVPTRSSTSVVLAGLLLTFCALIVLGACGREFAPATPLETSTRTDAARHWVPFEGRPTPPPCSANTTRLDCDTSPASRPGCQRESWLGGLPDDDFLSRGRRCPGVDTVWEVHGLGRGGPIVSHELVALTPMLGLESFPEVRMNGVGPCCPTQPDSGVCLVVWMLPCGRSPEVVLRNVEAVAERSPSRGTFGLSIEVLPGERCSRSDAACLPLSSNVGANLDPNADRVAVSPSAGSCAHDGECRVYGTSNTACKSWRSAPHTEAASGAPGPVANRWCGCVASGCAFFR